MRHGTASSLLPRRICLHGLQRDNFHTYYSTLESDAIMIIIVCVCVCVRVYVCVCVHACERVFVAKGNGGWGSLQLPEILYAHAELLHFNSDQNMVKATL